MADFEKYIESYKSNYDCPRGTLVLDTVLNNHSEDSAIWYADEGEVGGSKVYPGRNECDSPWENIETTQLAHRYGDNTIDNAEAQMEEWAPEGPESGSVAYRVGVSAAGARASWYYSQKYVERTDQSASTRMDINYDYNTETAQGSSNIYDVGSTCKFVTGDDCPPNYQEGDVIMQTAIEHIFHKEWSRNFQENYIWDAFYVK